MPWYKRKSPNSWKKVAAKVGHKSVEVGQKAAEIGGALLRRGYKTGRAFAAATAAQAKAWARSRNMEVGKKT